MLSKGRDSPELLVYNVVNPSTTLWSELLSAIEVIGPATIVSATEWIDRLEMGDKKPHIIHQIPVVKLINMGKEAILDGPRSDHS